MERLFNWSKQKSFTFRRKKESGDWKWDRFLFSQEASPYSLSTFSPFSSLSLIFLIICFKELEERKEKSSLKVSSHGKLYFLDISLFLFFCHSLKTFFLSLFFVSSFVLVNKFSRFPQRVIWKLPKSAKKFSSTIYANCFMILSKGFNLFTFNSFVYFKVSVRVRKNQFSVFVEENHWKISRSFCKSFQQFSSDFFPL